MDGRTQYGLENLADVHSRRHTQRVEHDVDRCTVGQEGHILLTHHFAHDTLVTVASGHLVAHANLSFLGNVDLGHLDDAAGQLVADGNGKLAALHLGIHELVLLQVIDDKLADELVGVLICGPSAQLHGRIVERVEDRFGNLGTLGNEVDTHVVLHAHALLALGELEQLVHENGFQVGHLAVELIVDGLQARLVLCLGGTCLDGTGEQFLVNDHATERRTGLERGILHVAGLVAEDGAEQLLLGTGVAFALGRNLADHNVAGSHTCADADDTVLVEVLGGFLAHIGDVGGEFLHTALGLAHLQVEFLHMDAGEDILAHHTFVEHNGVLIIVTLPGHVGNQQVLAQCQLAVLGAVAVGQNLALLHTVALADDGAQVDGHVLVGAPELGYAVFLERRLEADKLLVLGAVIEDADGGSVHIVHRTGSLGGNHGAAVLAHLALDTCTHDGSLGAHQRHCLAHHVGAHQSAVGIVVLKEGDQAGCDARNLLGSHIHEVHFSRGYHGIVVVLTALHLGTDEGTVVVEGGIALTDDLAFLLLCGEVADAAVVEVHHTVLHHAVGRLDKAKVVDLGKDAERGDKADVGTFGALDGAQTAVMGVMYVAHLKTGTLAAQTTHTQGGEAAFMGDFGQGVGLVHELAQGIGAEETVDDTADGLGIDEVGG